MDKINAPDYAFGLILAWARGASAEEYSFHPQGGLDCAHNVTVLVKSIANAKQVLPSVFLVSSPHGPPCDVVVFDFVPQLLCLLQNPSLMIPDRKCCVGLLRSFETLQKLQWPFRRSIVWECLPKSLFTFNHQSLLSTSCANNSVD
jgi:hypothetical protein